MSAFVCSSKTINKIVSTLTNYADTNDSIRRPNPRYVEGLIDLLGDPAELGKTLYKMNVNAVEQRYPDCVGNPDRLPGEIDQAGNHAPYQYAPVLPQTAITFYKSLSCYLYQCSEGDVDELPLYKMLKEFAGNVAEWIVTQTKEYEKAPWE